MVAFTSPSNLLELKRENITLTTSSPTICHEYLKSGSGAFVPLRENKVCLIFASVTGFFSLTFNGKLSISSLGQLVEESLIEVTKRPLILGLLTLTKSPQYA
jgi:hypothetical protein